MGENTSKPKLQKREDGGIDVVVNGHGVIGFVRREESSKTGFRRGRCIGQVPVNVWRAYAPAAAGTHLEGHPRNYAQRFGAGGGFGTRAGAVAALIEWRLPATPPTTEVSDG